MPRRCVLIIALGLAGCAASPDRSLPRWQDAAALAEAEATLCELAADCADLRIELLDVERPVAEIRASFHIVLSRGLWQRTANADERRFVIAHELGHRALGHFRPRDHAARLPQELEADAWAADRLCTLGRSTAAGGMLLQRLHDEVAQLDSAAADLPADDDAAALRAAALHEYRQRLAALRPCAR
jgi:hypothetical protein